MCCSCCCDASPADFTTKKILDELISREKHCVDFFDKTNATQRQQLSYLKTVKEFADNNIKVDFYYLSKALDAGSRRNVNDFIFYIEMAFPNNYLDLSRHLESA